MEEHLPNKWEALSSNPHTAPPPKNKHLKQKKKTYESRRGITWGRGRRSTRAEQKTVMGRVNIIKKQ
jgi:hypothetical protein